MNTLIAVLIRAMYSGRDIGLLFEWYGQGVGKNGEPSRSIIPGSESYNINKRADSLFSTCSVTTE
jgi:hypothetical protein